jgi:pimeloyl-ACP methyl ester carboxylesterase
MNNPFRLALAAALVAAALAVPTPAQADGTDPSWATCAQYTVPVTLTASDPTVYHVVGRLCTRTDKLRGAKTVQLLVSGWSYDHNYWNVATQPDTYSWVYAETSKGYSTFNIDRLGVGLSDKPPAAELTMQNEAWEIQQIIQALRAGTVGGISFQIVVGVGHSLGSAILQYEAATVSTAGATPDYLILEDFLTQAYLPGVVRIANSLYPASSDPAFASAGLPSGYLTTQPGTRSADFYYTPGVDPALVSLDESTKATGTDGERTSLQSARDTAITHGVHVPTLIAVGQYDNIGCDEASGLTCATSAAVLTRESGNWSARACLHTYVVTNSGHDVNLHIKAHDLYNFAATWLDNNTINYVSGKDANGCIPV